MKGLKGLGAGEVVRHNKTHVDDDKCLISLLNQRENNLFLYFKRVQVSADFAWIGYSSLGWAVREKLKVSGDCQAYLLSSFMGRYGQLLSSSPSFPWDETSPGAGLAGPTPAKHLSTCLTFNTSITHRKVRPRRSCSCRDSGEKEMGRW